MDTVTRYVIHNGKMEEFKISKKESMRGIKRILKKDKVFLKNNV